MAEKGVVFRPSFYEAMRYLKDKDQAALFRAICEYGFYDQKPEGLNPTLYGFFVLIQPVGNHNDVFSWVSSFLFSESTFAAAAAPAQQYTLSIRNGKVNILQTAFRTAQIGKGYIPKFNRCAVTFHIS